MKEHEAAGWLEADCLDDAAWLPADLTIIPMIRDAIIDRAAAEAPPKYPHAFE